MAYPCPPVPVPVLTSLLILACKCATVTPQSKSSSMHKSHETRNTGNVKTMAASSSCSDGSPTLAVSPTSSVPSPQDVRSMLHAHAPPPALTVSHRPSSFSGGASNPLSSLGQPIPSRHPFAFHHPARGGSISMISSTGSQSTGSPRRPPNGPAASSTSCKDRLGATLGTERTRSGLDDLHPHILYFTRNWLSPSIIRATFWCVLMTLRWLP